MQPAYTIGQARGGLPLIGHVLHLLTRPLQLFQTIRADGDLVVLRMGPTPIYVVNHPELIRQVLVTDAKKFDKGLQFEKARPYVGNGIATSSEPFHLHQRRLMQPAFHHAQITRYAESMRQSAQATISSWRLREPIELERELLQFTIRVLTETLFSTEADASAMAAVTETLPILLSGVAWRIAVPAKILEKLPLRAIRSFEEGRLRLWATIDQLIAARRKATGSHEDLLSMLLDARDEHTGAGMTDEQVRDEALTMLLAGSETTASTLGWVCHLLGEHPDVQRRVHAEIDAAVGARPITADDLPRLVYTRQVICEALRLYPPVWLASRRPLVDIEIGGHRIPAGSNVFFCPYGLHRDPNIYSNPDRFDPERWTGETFKSMSRPTFIPFGSGGRGCIGESFAWTEMMVFLGTLLQTYTLRTPPNRRVRVVARGSLRGHGIAAIITPRSGVAAPR